MVIIAKSDVSLAEMKYLRLYIDVDNTHGSQYYVLLMIFHYFWSNNLSTHIWLPSTPDQRTSVSHINKKACGPLLHVT